MTSLAKRLSRRLRSTAGAGPRVDGAPTDSIAALLEPLEAPFGELLRSMYEGAPQSGSDGQHHPMDPITRISPSEGRWLHDFCLSQKPRATVEIGMAYGFSTLYFLAAIARNGAGRVTSVDPFQNTIWHGIGATLAQKHARPGTFSLIEDRSDRAATDLARAGATFDLIFIDGAHRFDDALVDFYLYEQLCNTGGHIIFDDMWMSSIQTVVSFVRANRRDYDEVPASETNISVFRKIGTDTRDWDEFQPFPVAAAPRRRT